MAKTKKAENAQIKVTLVRSTIGCTEPQIRSFKIHNENPCILGMVKKVNHLVKVEKVEA